MNLSNLTPDEEPTDPGEHRIPMIRIARRVYLLVSLALLLNALALGVCVYLLTHRAQCLPTN